MGEKLLLIGQNRNLYLACVCVVVDCIHHIGVGLRSAVLIFSLYITQMNENDDVVL